MATLGFFVRSETGEFSGRIETLTFSANLSFVETKGKVGEASPSHRIYVGVIEVGVAWEKYRANGDVYYSVKIDDPSFAQPIFATLIEANGDGLHPLIWNRPGSARHRQAA
jgi:uncharacterized protein (DUF736 family)